MRRFSLRRRTRYDRFAAAAAHIKKLADTLPEPETPRDIMGFCAATEALGSLFPALEHRLVELRLCLDVPFAGAEVEVLAGEKLAGGSSQRLDPWVVIDAAVGPEYCGSPCVPQPVTVP